MHFYSIRYVNKCCRVIVYGQLSVLRICLEICYQVIVTYCV